MKDRVKFLRQIAAAQTLYAQVNALAVGIIEFNCTDHRRLSILSQKLRDVSQALMRNLGVGGHYCHIDQRALRISIWQEDADQVYDFRGNFIGYGED